MVQRLLGAAACGALVFALCVRADAQTDLTGAPTVAVLEFDYGAVKVQWPQHGGRSRQAAPNIDALDVGKGMANLMVAELLEGGGFRIVERQRIADVERESGPEHIARPRYLVIGTVTQFGGEQKTRQAGAFASTVLSLAARRPLFGMFKTKDTYAYVGLSCRVVDATTGEVIGAANAHGQSTRSGLLLGGLGGRPLMGAGLSIDSADFQATILGEATMWAVREAAAKLRQIFARVP